MATLLDLYNMRRNIAQKRQHSHLEKYEKLHEFLLSLEKAEPYDLGFDTKLKFEAVAFFVDNPFGHKARIPNRDTFIYRICSIRDVVKGTDWRKDEGTDAANWMKVYDKSKGNWTPLSRFARGTYCCHPRCFSWWTSYPLFEDVIRGAHKIGMTNDWVAVETVVLRCPVDYVSKNKLAVVPTVIDAFMQLIFHPTKDSISPTYGITIDLSLYPRTLSPGLDEVVLPALDIDRLEVLPIKADQEYREGKNQVLSESEVLAGLLEFYYQNL